MLLLKTPSGGQKEGRPRTLLGSFPPAFGSAWKPDRAGAARNAADPAHDPSPECEGAQRDCLRAAKSTREKGRAHGFAPFHSRARPARIETIFRSGRAVPILPHEARTPEPLAHPQGNSQSRAAALSGYLPEKAESTKSRRENFCGC